MLTGSDSGLSGILETLKRSFFGHFDMKLDEATILG